MAGALWRQAREALSGIASLAGTYDSDGIDIYFLNNPQVGRNLVVRRLTTNRATSDPPTERQGCKAALQRSSPTRYVPRSSSGAAGKQAARLFAPSLSFLILHSPEGITPIGAKLEELLLDYLIRLEQTLVDPAAPGVKPVNFIVITDGAPTDDPESVIITAARRLDKNNFPLSQVGIQFVQIGADPDATEALRALDDELSGEHNIRVSAKLPLK
jgi:hypothetical protein